MSHFVQNQTNLTGSQPWVKFCFVAVLAFCLMACGRGGERLAGGGTGTSAGNTITARVLDSSGAPSVGTEVVIHPIGFIPDSILLVNAQAATQAGKKTLTDSLGIFRINLDSGASYLLECKRGTSSKGQVLWVENLRPNGDGTTMNLGDLALQNAAVLSGYLFKSPNGSDPKGRLGADKIWVGFRGTGNFVRADSGGFFFLSGIPAGSHDLSLLRVSPSTPLQVLTISGWRIAAGSHAVIDTLLLPPPGPESVRLSVTACVENVTSLVEYEYVGVPAAGVSKVLRSYLYTNPPQWMELDPCLGTWRKLGALPSGVNTATGSFSTDQTDFILLGDQGNYFQIDTAAIVSTPRPLPPNLANVEYYGGKYYAMFWGDSGLKVFPSEAALFGGGPSNSLPIGFPITSLWDIAIVDSIAYFGSPKDTLQIYKYDLRSHLFQLHSVLPNFGGVFFGITSEAKPGNKLWLLNDKKELMLYDPESKLITRRIKVQAPAGVRGLTRFRRDGD